MTPITHPLLDLPGIRHGFFTREGGVSQGLYEGLNCGVGSKDDPAHVAENRRRVAAWFGRDYDDLCGCYQVHSAHAVVANQGWSGERPEGDAVVTAVAGPVATVLTADCAPILFADAEARVVATAHAGWKGALGGIIQATVEAMVQQGAAVERIRAVVGPCISQTSYEVGADYQARFATEAPGSERFFAAGTAKDKRQFDLPGFVLWRLDQAGVQHAAWTGDDTRTNEARFYSNRRAYLNGEPDFGRLIGAIALI
ncbi:MULTISPECIES: peptidoglycan editing factor PgeF [unclassified Brevundimonas]|uniref:peptidoglycan editing factor PgeF n=1 Tax=unclassified Brevundimonas TaxID=2622653 RepID=UPI0025C632F2|nr:MULTISPECIES: peptidoglycan editing factor PgeF [unclassified Brevundimonas]